MLPMQVSYWEYVEQKRHNLATEKANQLQANAAWSQAESAKQNANTNKYNADINRYNAETNRYNADINANNAWTNARNAATNERNAATNERNAAVNEQNAVTNARQATVREGELRLDQSKFPYYVMDAQSSRTIAQAQERNSYTNQYTAATQRTQGERSLEIQDHNAYTNEYNAKVNAKAQTYQNAYTQAKTSYQVRENKWQNVLNAANLVNTTSQSTYNYAKAIESAMNAAGKFVTIPSQVLAQFYTVK